MAVRPGLRSRLFQPPLCHLGSGHETFSFPGVQWGQRERMTVHVPGVVSNLQ